MPLPEPTEVEPLVKPAFLCLGQLAGTPMQPKMTEADVPVIARRHAQLMAFFGTTPDEVATEPLLYQAEIDYLLSVMESADDATILKFLGFVGQPLTPEQFTAWFFSR